MEPPAPCRTQPRISHSMFGASAHRVDAMTNVLNPQTKTAVPRSDHWLRRRKGAGRNRQGCRRPRSIAARTMARRTTVQPSEAPRSVRTRRADPSNCTTKAAMLASAVTFHGGKVVSLGIPGEDGTEGSATRVRTSVSLQPFARR